MAGRGPAPRENPRRRNQKPAGLTLAAKPVVIPDLPEQYEWPQRTQDWWQMWRETPQAELFTATDWDFLLDTALLHAQFWLGDTSVSGELRLRVAKFGATTEDRQRLRMTFGPEAKQYESADVTHIDSYRDL